MDQAQISCAGGANGYPAGTYTCNIWNLTPCTPQSGCSSDPNADKDGDGAYVQTPNCTPDPTLIDCNDDRADVRPGPGRTETSCFPENPRVDEDGDGKFDCEDEDCRTAAGSACDAQCDQDEDGHYKRACGGDDCEDDYDLSYGGNERHEDYATVGGIGFCQNGHDEDCDDLPDCFDPDCSTDEACLPTPTPPPPPGGEPIYQANQTYCYSYYAVTDWFISYDGGVSWSYSHTSWDYIGQDCYLMYS